MLDHSMESLDIQHLSTMNLATLYCNNAVSLNTSRQTDCNGQPSLQIDISGRTHEAWCSSVFRVRLIVHGLETRE